MNVKLFGDRQEGPVGVVNARPIRYASERLPNLRELGQNICLTLALLTLALAQTVQAGGYGSDGKSPPLEQASVDWREFAISPVSNPIFFEDPRIETGVRLIYLYNRVSDDLSLNLGGTNVNLGGADIHAYGAQIRYAITPRLAFIATNDVGIYFEPDRPIPGTAFQRQTGYSDLDVGFKYALIDDPAHQFLLTPILTYAIPTGARRVFQGDNSGIFDVAVSSEKGFDKFHLIGNIGVRIPVDTDRNSTELHYSLHADYYVNRFFIPLVEFNGWTVLDSPRGNKGPLGGFGTALNTEGADLINFGASNLEGNTQAAFGVGFRSKFCKYVDFGVVYEHTVTSPEGAFEQRVTTDLIFHF
ncbi:MAG TPA: hypothetical protein VGQ82_10200 [Chthoniobacterales bacterium]|nr:hypothetical protein [Chthoniobacterales bacterium]